MGFLPEPDSAKRFNDEAFFRSQTNDRFCDDTSGQNKFAAEIFRRRCYQLQQADGIMLAMNHLRILAARSH